MKRIIMLLVVIACLGFTAMPVCAQDDAKPVKEATKEKPVLKELTVVGKITITEKKNKKDEVITRYVLTDAEGKKIAISQPKAPKKKKNDVEPAQVINLDDYLDIDVKVSGKAKEIEKKGKKRVCLKTITSIEKISK